MPRMTFTEDFRKDLDAQTSVFYPAGGTFDVPEDLMPEVQGVAAPAAAVAPASAAPPQGSHGIG